MTAWMALLGALTGACLGSFAATAALRHADGRQALLGRSSCDHCDAALSFVKTAPIISYVGLRGTCASCGGKISLHHLAGELAGAIVVGASFAILPLERAGLVALIGLALIAASITDAAVRRLPDTLTLVVAICAAALASLGGAALLEGIAAAVIVFALLELLRRGYRRVRGRDGLGFGDVKLLSALALWLGAATPWALCLAAAGGLIGAMLRPRDGGRIAFGPYIAGSAWLVGLVMEATP